MTDDASGVPNGGVPELFAPIMDVDEIEGGVWCAKPGASDEEVGFWKPRIEGSVGGSGLHATPV